MSRRVRPPATAAPEERGPDPELPPMHWAQPPSSGDPYVGSRIAEAFQTLHAIQTGGVDAFVVAGPAGERLLVLDGADAPYRLVVDEMGEGMLVLDAAGIVLFANRALSAMTGLPAGEIVGRPVGCVLEAASAARVAGALADLLDHPGHLSADLVRAHGPTLPVHLSARPVHSGSFAGVLVIATDVSPLREAERWFRQALETMPDPVLLIRPVDGGTGEIVDFVVEYGNPASAVVGVDTGAESSGARLFELHPAARAPLMGPLLATLQTGTAGVMDGVALTGGPSSTPTRVRHFDIHAARREGGLILGLRDITDRRRTGSLAAMQFAVTRALSDSASMEEAAPRILEALGTALGAWAGAIRAPAPGEDELAVHHSWHAPGVDTVQFDGASHRLRPTPATGLLARVRSTRMAASTADLTTDAGFALEAVARDAGLLSGTAIPIVADGTMIGLIELFFPVIQEPDAELLEVMTDLGGQVGQFMERRRVEWELREHTARLAGFASTDALTGLTSRREFDRLLTTIPRKRFAILVIDVDNLKEVNDEYGHEGGDTVLQAVAMVLSSLVRGWDVVARIGGDEFAAILNDVGGEEVAAASERLRLGMHSISLPYGTTRVSIGWVAAPAGADPHAVLNAADQALLIAKRGGRDLVEGGDLQTGVVSGSARVREAEMVSEVLVAHAMGVAFQPVVELAGGAVIGFEALARPSGRGAGTSVESLFAAARGVGRIRDLDWLCRRTAVEGATGLPAGAILFVNISSAALLDPLHDVDHLLLLLEWAGRSPHEIVLEITEQEVVRGLGRLGGVVAAYRRHGVRFAVDAVGQGHSAPELLAAASPEFVMLSAGLTAGAARSGPRAAIEAAISLARSGGGSVIAEGIEDEATAARMADLGIAFGRGGWLGEPVLAAPPIVLPGRPAAGVRRR